LVEALLADGHNVTILAPHDETVPQLERLGCRYVRLQMDNKGLNPAQAPAMWLRFRRHFKDLRPDLVFGFTIKPNLFGAMAARSLGIPFIPNVTGLGTAFLGSKALRLVAEQLYRVAFSRLPAIFFQNGDDKDLFVSRRLTTAAQSRLLPGSGIDLQNYSARPYPASGPISFLMIARLIRDKGVFEFVEAAKLVAERGLEARFLLLGPLGSKNRTGISTDQLDQWVKDGLVEYLGTTDDVRPFLADAHCVVLPSYREGAPRTLIEGAALGRPAIASDVTGCNTVVEHGETGLLCEVRSAESLAQAMMSFAQLPSDMRAKMGEDARAKMEREFGVDRVIDAYRQAIHEIVGNEG